MTTADGYQIDIRRPGFLSQADWLDARRATAWLRTLAVVIAAVALGWIVLSWRGIDPTGRPLGTDFLAFWTAGRLELAGAGGAAPYNQDLHAAWEHGAFPTLGARYAPFPYPPTFLLICTPLALLPYFPAAFAWIAAGLLGYWRAVRAWLGGSGPALAVFAYPGVVVAATAGQTAFLTTALFGAGGLWLQRRPWLAGVCLGCLTLKPHVGLLIPVALIASRNWRAFLVAGATTLILAGGAGLAFGAEAWMAFIRQLSMMRSVIEGHGLDPSALVTAFGAARVLGAPLWAAYAAQGAIAAAAGITVALVAARAPRSQGMAATLVAASLLSSPYLMFYDLALTALPLAWLFARGRQAGFLPWEKLVMLAAYILPLVSITVGDRLHLPLAPPVLLALTLACARRTLLEGQGDEPLRQESALAERSDPPSVWGRYRRAGGPS
jgi:hypothetical protein